MFPEPNPYPILSFLFPDIMESIEISSVKIEELVSTSIKNQKVLISTNDEETHSIFVFLPKLDIQPYCQEHKSPISDTGRWTNNEWKKFPPRKVYDLNGNFFLISKVYQCPGCGYILGHSEKMQPFSLGASSITFFHQMAISRLFLTSLVSSISEGKLELLLLTNN